MKNLSIEQKAKAYDKALAIARDFYNSTEYAKSHAEVKAIYEAIFPELAESKDEKIRKAMIKYFTNGKEYLSLTPYSREDYIAWLEKYGERNSADKVEPKFKVGDWVMLDRPVLITKVEDMPYNTHQYWTSDGTWFGDGTKAKLWTIQDAKDGDVLAYNDGSLIIFRYRLSGLDAGLYMSHILLTDKIEFKQTCAISNVHPATKEQRDLLFQKMKEAGYEWDAEKKELKEIEHNPAWSEEEEYLQAFIIELLYGIEDTNDKEYEKKCRKAADWLKSLRPQNSWKPSMAQLNALSIVSKGNITDDIEAIVSLYQDLKKLREE